MITESDEDEAPFDYGNNQQPIQQKDKALEESYGNQITTTEENDESPYKYGFNQPPIQQKYPIH